MQKVADTPNDTANDDIGVFIEELTPYQAAFVLTVSRLLEKKK